MSLKNMSSFITCLFINKYLLTSYCVPDTTLGAGNTALNGTDKDSVSSMAWVEKVQMVNILGFMGCDSPASTQL